ncbi:hypothetical protein AAE478_000110 [Parahypoxylon ruwenzoriense]
MKISKANVKPAVMLPLTRYFSQTSRFAQEDKDVEGAAEFGEQTEQTGSAFDNSPSQSGQTDAAAAEEPQSIFISNITFDATEEHLRDAFSKYGEITALNLGRDGRGLSRGFGFITFTTFDAAERAVRDADKSFWHGRRINVDFKAQNATPKEAKTAQPPMEPSTSLYIGNIPYETSDTELNKIFRALDGVTDVRVAVDRNTGWPRGFAHADFVDVESAIAAHKKMSNFELGGRLLRIDFAHHRDQNRRQ